MGSAGIPTGLVKKEVMVIGVVVALAVGFLGGVIFSSFKAPQGEVVSQSKPAQAPDEHSPAAGPNSVQAANISSLELEVGRNASNGGAWIQLGNLYFDTNQPGKAIVAYNKALEINQGLPDVWTDLGVMYRSNRQFKEAIAAFDRAITLNPGMEQAYFNKGIVLVYDLGDKAAGIEAWQKTLSVNPNAKAPNGQLVRDILNSIK